MEEPSTDLSVKEAPAKRLLFFGAFKIVVKLAQILGDVVPKSGL